MSSSPDGTGTGGWRSHPPAALLVDLVYDELLDAIVERRLPPGTRLVPQVLARELGVSATPVKLALTRLAADGLVTDRARRGMSVAQLGPEEMETLFNARLFLEAGAAWSFFHNVTDDLVEAMEASAAAYEQVVRGGGEHLRRRLGDADRELHRFIVRLTRNEVILRWYEQVNIHIQGHQSAYPRERYEATIREHAAIVAAFRERDRDRAVTAIHDHLVNAKNHLMHMLRTAAETPRLRNIRNQGKSAIAQEGTLAAHAQATQLAMRDFRSSADY